MFFLPRIIAAMLAASALSACGQKGPLFLAPQSVPYSVLPGQATSPAAALPASPASDAK